MARDEEDFKTRRRREEKEEEERQAEAREAAANAGKLGRSVRANPPVHGDDPDAIMKQVEPLLEQLNNLYAMYLSGHEKRPPLEKRALVDSLMQRLITMSKATASLRFKVQTINSSYLSHRERWDKMLRSKEK